METFKNWALPILLIIAAFAEDYFSLIKEAIIAFEIDPKWIVILKIVFGLVAVVILKLQAPSLKKAKQAKEGYHPKL